MDTNELCIVCQNQKVDFGEGQDAHKSGPPAFEAFILIYKLLHNKIYPIMVLLL